MFYEKSPTRKELGYKYEDEKLVIDYSTKDVVGRIFDLYYNSNSYQKISNILNEEQALEKIIGEIQLYLQY